MRESFAIAMRPLLEHEGGFSNHPDDPGGPTMKGVTQDRYDGYRKLKGLPTQPVRLITDAEVLAIYKKFYWDASMCDELPLGIDYCIFDGAVNSGPTQAAKWLQRALGIRVDGHIGSITLSALEDSHADEDAAGDAIIDKICDQRLAFMRSLKNWESFKKGWTVRVKDVRKLSKEMNNHQPLSTPVTLDASDTGKALATNTRVSATPEGAAATKELTLGGGGIVAWLLSKFDSVSDNLSLLSGMQPDTAKILIEGVVVLAVLAMLGYGAYSLFTVFRRMRRGEEIEAN